MPAAEASQCVDVTIPNVPRSSGLVVNTRRTLVFASMPTCARCGTENPDGARFCNACGAALGEPVRGEERRIVSVLFVDLVGFTAQAEQLDPEDVRAILTPYYEHVRAELERFGGTVEKFVGDAVMGVFGAPTAYGDDAERAVRAALAVRDWAGENALEVRVAVNTGEAIVSLDLNPSQGEAMVAGDVVNTAARLQTAAPTGGVLVGDETYASTRNVIEYRPAEPISAKGKVTPVRVWLALKPLAAAGERPLQRVPMIGRDSELGVLIGVWKRVADERRPHLVTIFGPSGIGKSRLMLECAADVASRDARVLRGRSAPYGSNSPYSAFAQHVKQIAGIFDSDDPADARAKLGSTVAEAVGADEAEAHAEHLAMLLGLGDGDEASDRDTLFFSARVLVEAMVTSRPTLLIFEDIHWADQSLLDLIEMLAARVRDVPLMLLALARPEVLSERPGWGGGLPASTALPLEPLPDGSARELAERLLARAGAEHEPLDAIANTAEGNPLFIEELVASLAEHSTSDPAILPTSIRGIVSARLDALSHDERAALLDASVVGRVFWRGAIARIAAREDLGRILGSLEARDLITREAVSRIKGDQQFAFRHALIQEVAYQTLPRAARRERHAAVASYLDEMTGASGQSNEALAHHWREAGESDRAVDCLIVAGDQAGRGWAKEHAVALYKAALDLIPADDDRRATVMRRLAVALQAMYHLADARQLRGAEGGTS
jgi:class 3 adenylate cyclase